MTKTEFRKLWEKTDRKATKVLFRGPSRYGNKTAKTACLRLNVKHPNDFAGYLIQWVTGSLFSSTLEDQPELTQKQFAKYQRWLDEFNSEDNHDHQPEN